MKDLLKGLKRRVLSSSSRIKKYLHRKQTEEPLSSPKIEVFVRHCYYSDASHHKKRPSYFDRKKCFENLTSTINHDFVHVTCILDTFHAGEDPHFILDQDYFDVVTMEDGTEAGAFLKMLEIVEHKNLHPDTIVYFLEDDYVHQENWIEILLEGMGIEGVDYATLYDHPDKYTSHYQDLESKLYCTKSCHWRETPSTTNTYAMRAKTLKKHIRVHQEYSKNVSISRDHAKFCALSDLGAKLVSCIPGFSTHLESGNESPCVDWENILLRTEQKLSSLGGNP